jgi:hypothetical protein
MPQVQVAFISAAGEEREETWPSVESFRAWAQVQPVACTYTAYAEDADGEWVVIDRGAIGRGPARRP